MRIQGRFLAVLGILCGFLLTAGSALAMSVDDIIELLDSAVGEPVILDQIQAERAVFTLSTDDILDLKQAGASDRLIQEMIRTGDGTRRDRGPLGARDHEDWTDAYYDYPAVSLRLYYDPFGYHWFAWPYYFGYYYPFQWGDCAFYYAGGWSPRWWRSGHWVDYYWGHYHWDGASLAAGGRHAWDRGRGRSAGQQGRNRSVSAAQGRTREAPGVRSGSQRRHGDYNTGRAGTRFGDGSRPTGRDRPAWGRGERQGPPPGRPDRPPSQAPGRPEGSRGSKPEVQSGGDRPAPAAPAPPPAQGRPAPAGRHAFGR